MQPPKIWVAVFLPDELLFENHKLGVINAIVIYNHLFCSV